MTPKPGWSVNINIGMVAPPPPGAFFESSLCPHCVPALVGSTQYAPDPRFSAAPLFSAADAEAGLQALDSVQVVLAHRLCICLITCVCPLLDDPVNAYGGRCVCYGQC
jgi:hypothetical protein